MRSTVSALVAAVLLGGCAAAHELSLQYEPPTTRHLSSPPTVSLQVDDQRAFVASGEKTPSYVGHLRGGLGNTWNVTTADEVPLALQVRNDLLRELGSMGIHETPSGSDKAIVVAIREWNFDTGLDSRLWYDLGIEVRSGGEVLVSSSVKDERVIKGSVSSGPMAGIDREIPAIYADVIQGLVRNNPGVIAALRR